MSAKNVYVCAVASIALMIAPVAGAQQQSTVVGPLGGQVTTTTPGPVDANGRPVSSTTTAQGVLGGQASATVVQNPNGTTTVTGSGRNALGGTVQGTATTNAQGTTSTVRGQTVLGGSGQTTRSTTAGQTTVRRSGRTALGGTGSTSRTTTANSSTVQRQGTNALGGSASQSRTVNADGSVSSQVQGTTVLGADYSCERNAANAGPGRNASTTCTGPGGRTGTASSTARVNESGAVEVQGQGPAGRKVTVQGRARP